jgi:hypothetical protein
MNIDQLRAKWFLSKNQRLKYTSTFNLGNLAKESRTIIQKKEILHSYPKTSSKMWTKSGRFRKFYKINPTKKFRNKWEGAPVTGSQSLNTIILVGFRRCSLEMKLATLWQTNLGLAQLLGCQKRTFLARLITDLFLIYQILVEMTPTCKILIEILLWEELGEIKYPSAKVNLKYLNQPS